ncbi:Peptidyl-prolyl cis-trans isomerase pin1 [Psilocybe cubensis]|uniref:Peptidyl-prolyl cis-trans isomerase pin1 n=1 Tax=Psilocybe cubensis TaxID=181762 RepID=A0ACB8HF17_PSICU|nr:Peptidyl-prolyl cis-trans isomerase pin1 [Psilocybe cubensis]KAH9486403.1 Peptidyl-prolyl cis-trans isomerase pin1 [Psilocybe cubensis]
MSSSKGLPYFFNNQTKQSSWDAPSELSQQEIDSLPGAKEYLNGKGGAAGAHAGQSNITRTKEEAIEILRGYQAQINGSQEKFAELATLHSDCSSHSNGGDLGWFGRGQMQKPFEDAAYGLEPGQISDIISSDSGVHLVLRTA